MEQLERIRKMEEKLDRASAALRALEDAAAAYEAAADDLRDLEAYLSGNEWRADFEAEEKGLLPVGLKRGVLSEDGIYDLLEEEGELLRRLKALAEAYESRPGAPEEGEITSFETVTLRESGMRGSVEYEITAEGKEAEVSRYRIRYAGREKQRVLEKRTSCGVKKALRLLNDCGLLSWDGFNGPHPADVLDGIMFTLEAVVNDGRRISARGSENFPPHYRAFTGGLYRLLEGED